jgi:hypothetical protein
MIRKSIPRLSPGFFSPLIPRSFGAPIARLFIADLLLWEGYSSIASARFPHLAIVRLGVIT